MHKLKNSQGGSPPRSNNKRNNKNKGAAAATATNTTNDNGASGSGSSYSKSSALVKEANAQERTVVNPRPKYLPNLSGLLLPRFICEHADRFILVPLNVQTHPHDAASALSLKEEKCISFDLPRSLFPNHAPLGKITFLPNQLIPPGFDAAGVFATGVLPRRSYPIGLLGPQQKGPTPALFIGRRSGSMEQQHKSVKPVPVLATIPHAPPVRYNKHTPTTGNAAAVAELQQRLIRNEVTVGQVIHQQASLAAVAEFLKCKTPMQYNIYVPDMSVVVVVVPHPCRLSAVILSTVVNPHVPTVAFATMGDDEYIPRFELPGELFPSGDNYRRPVFLPPRYLPRGFEAGCIFAPGSLPDALFQGPLKVGITQPQHSSAMTPPLFVGLVQRINLNAEQELTKSIQMLAVNGPGGSSLAEVGLDPRQRQDSPEPMDVDLTDEELLQHALEQQKLVVQELALTKLAKQKRVQQLEQLIMKHHGKNQQRVEQLREEQLMEQEDGQRLEQEEEQQKVVQAELQKLVKEQHQKLLKEEHQKLVQQVQEEQKLVHEQQQKLLQKQHQKLVQEEQQKLVQLVEEQQKLVQKEEMQQVLVQEDEEEQEEEVQREEVELAGEELQRVLPEEGLQLADAHLHDQPTSSRYGTLEFVESQMPPTASGSQGKPVKTFHVDEDIDVIGQILDDIRERGVDLVLKGELAQGFNYERACAQFKDMIERRDEIRAQMNVSMREHEERMQRTNRRALRKVKNKQPEKEQEQQGQAHGPNCKCRNRR
ncbi:hypothetical protein KR009_004507 [Drosophila setifemur]|nr:hypothetical protein KR009_004507 [Drosophila setifemur]